MSAGCIPTGRWSLGAFFYPHLALTGLGKPAVAGRVLASAKIWLAISIYTRGARRPAGARTWSRGRRRERPFRTTPTRAHTEPRDVCRIVLAQRSWSGIHG